MSPVGHHLAVPTGTTPSPILPIELIALDIDGTLIGDDLVIGPDTRAAVAAAMRRGVQVSLVTGRMVSSAMRFARELGLTGPIVGYQGGLIRAMPVVGSGRLGRLLVHTPIRAEVAREIVEWTLAHGLDPHINHLERFVLRAGDPNADDYSAFMGARAELVDDLAGSIRHPVTKVLAVGEPPLPIELAPLARAQFAGRADVTISHPRFLEVVARGVSKGRAVRWLARHLGVTLGATLAIGDQWNDLEMLSEVGHGTAMPTAPRTVRAAARYIAPSVADEGVARMIEWLVLGSPADARAAADRLAAEASLAVAGAPDAEAGLSSTESAPGPARGEDPGVSARVVRDDPDGRAAAIEVLRDGGVVALPTDTVYGIGVALGTQGGVERLFRVKRRPPDKGIMLLLERAAQAGEIGVMTPAALALAGAMLAGRADPRGSGAGRRVPAGRVDLGDGHDRAARPRSRGAADARASRRAAADDVGQRVGSARGAGCRGHPGPARRRDRPDPRRRPCPRRPGLDRRGLHRGAAGGASRGGGPARASDRDPGRGRRAARVVDRQVTPGP